MSNFGTSEIFKEIFHWKFEKFQLMIEIRRLFSKTITEVVKTFFGRYYVDSRKILDFTSNFFESLIWSFGIKEWPIYEHL